MKRFSTRQSTKAKGSHHSRRGSSGIEVVIATVVVLSFTMGMYFLSEKCFSRLYHFIATMTGSYL